MNKPRGRKPGTPKTGGRKPGPEGPKTEVFTKRCTPDQKKQLQAYWKELDKPSK